jgi:hypothetical protein
MLANNKTAGTTTNPPSQCCIPNGIAGKGNHADQLIEGRNKKNYALRK